VKVFLVNIGANTSHARVARAPRFADGSWVPVPFPEKPKPGLDLDPACRPEAAPYTRARTGYGFHHDPDWDGLTYGDRVENRRGQAVGRATAGDWLLFWGLTWGCEGEGIEACRGEKRWGLFGAMRVERVVRPADVVSLTGPDRERVEANMHARSGTIRDGDVVVLADERGPGRFDRVVELGAHRDGGLLFRAFRARDGRALRRGASPRWHCSLRSVRAVFDTATADRDEGARLELVREAIRREAGVEALEEA